MEKEKEAIAHLPYSKEELEKALTEVGRRHTKPAGAPGAAGGVRRSPETANGSGSVRDPAGHR
jgi:hypothetical protein